MAKLVIFAQYWDQNRTLSAPEVRNEQYWTFLRSSTVHYKVVKTKELTSRQVLSVPCITCGAAIGERCELHTGALRTEPHRDRKLSATEAVEMKTRKR